ncbi:MAG: hypothetical protein IJG47_07720 [Microbacterium sp.]|nr:hypothetical protein [Microbacterium sp.]
MTDEQLFDRAHDVNFEFKEAIADAQLQILDGMWEIGGLGYGESPRSCGTSGYSFELRRDTPPEFKLENSAAETAEHIGAWLDDHGWSSISIRTDSEGIADIVIEAKKPDAFVDRMLVDVKPAPETYDIVTVTATSTCEPGDWKTIEDLRRPAELTDTIDLELKPESEHPTAAPSFGYTPDGKRRFWDEADD